MPAENRTYPRSADWYARRVPMYMRRSQIRTARAVTGHIMRGDFAQAMQTLNDGAMTYLQWRERVHPALNQ